MEINRKVLRKNAWNALKGIYWFMFLICLLASIIGVNGGGVNIGRSFSSNIDTAYTTEDVPDIAQFGSSLPEIADGFTREFSVDGAAMVVMGLIVLGLVVIVFWLLSILFTVFVVGPAGVSFAKLKLSAVVDREKNFDYALFGFRNKYLSNAKTMFLRRLYIFLCQLPMLILFYGLLFVTLVFFFRTRDAATVQVLSFAGLTFLAWIGLVIVSIWKKYQYLLVPYIVAENPGMKAREAIRLSSEMMRGFKLQAFVLRLSFIGWGFLGLLCCGIGLLFVAPYYQATETLLYEELKAHYNGNVIETDVAPETAE